MKQADSYNRDFTDKVNVTSEGEIEETEDWHNEHGQPDFGYLYTLATDGSPEAMEKLRSIAGDLNVAYDSDTSPENLIERIRSATAQNENGDSGDTT
jgi:hypothetical protein